MRRPIQWCSVLSCGRLWQALFAVWVFTWLHLASLQAVASGVEILSDETRADGFAEDGGGLFSGGPTSVASEAVVDFTGNTAFGSGGGLYSADTVSLKDAASVNLVNNSAGVKGGGVYSGGDMAGSDNTTINARANVANRGGGVYAEGTLTLAGQGDFTGNIAKDMGGAIFATGDVFLTGDTDFVGNTALQGGAIYSTGNVYLRPDEAETIRFSRNSDSIYAAGLVTGGQGTVIFNAPNTIAGSVVVTSGTTRLSAANVFRRTALRVQGGTLHMGDSLAVSTPPASSNVTGAGSAAPFATQLRGLHLGDGATLSLDMNVPGQATVPYFTLADGYAATTGTGTTLYGVIGSRLLASGDGRWTYTLFSGSSGAEGDFAPAFYSTSNALVSLVNPVYKDGEFTLEVVRKTAPVPGPTPPSPDPIPPIPDPVPPSPGPVISGGFMELFPANSLRPDMEMILYYDYFYNGGTIDRPGPGTLIGQNRFLDGLLFVRPNGQAAFTPQQRLVALESAVSMADMAGSTEILQDTANRLREELFASDAAHSGRVTMTSTASGTGIRLWASPSYSREIGRNRDQYGGLRADYRADLYGGMIGLEGLFAEGTVRTGGVFTVGHGKLESRADAGVTTTNRADYAGGALYSVWLPSPEWEIGIHAGYIGQKNAVDQSNILKLESEFDASLRQIGLNAQYTTTIGNDGKRKLVAGIGVDARQYTRDSLDVTANDENIAKMSKARLRQVQIPVSVGVQDTFAFENGSSLTVDVRTGYRLTRGDLAVESDWSIPGGAYRARVCGPDADRHTGLVGAGIVWQQNALSVGLDYAAEISPKRTGHQLSAQVRWTF